MKEIRPSDIPKLEGCAVFRSEGSAGTAAHRGTDIDAATRGILQANLAPLGKLPPEDIEAAQWGAEKLRELGGLHHVETREEFLAMAVPWLSVIGTADAVCRAGRWVADIKTGAQRDYSGQLAAYALACMNDAFCNEWTAHVVYVDQRQVRSYRFTRDEAEEKVRTTIERATSGEAEPTPCDYCSWCAHRPTCRALVRQSTEALALVASPGASLEGILQRILASPEELSAFAANWKTAERFIAEPALEALKARLSAGEDIPGWRTTTTTGREYVEAPAILAAAKEVSKETLVFAMGGKMTGKAYRAFCADSGISPDESAVLTGAPITTLRQTKNKN